MFFSGFSQGEYPKGNNLKIRTELAPELLCPCVGTGKTTVKSLIGHMPLKSQGLTTGQISALDIGRMRFFRKRHELCQYIRL